MISLSWLVAALVVCAAAAYWLGHRHGSANNTAPPARPETRPIVAVPLPPPPVHHIPPYRVRELTVLMELGVLTPEEFEHEKGKLLAGRN